MSRMTRTMTAVSAAALHVRRRSPSPSVRRTPRPAPGRGRSRTPEAAAQPLAEPPRDPSTVVAKAGSADDHRRRCCAGAGGIRRTNSASVPEAQQRSVLVDALVNMQLLAQAARDAGLDKGPEFERRLDIPEAAGAAQCLCRATKS